MCAPAPAATIAALAELRQLPMVHEPPVSPSPAPRRRRASAGTPAIPFAKPLLVEDDPDVNLRKHGGPGTVGQISGRPVPQRTGFPRRAELTTAGHPEVSPTRVAGRRRPPCCSLLRRIGFYENLGELIAEVISAASPFQPPRPRPSDVARSILKEAPQKSSPAATAGRAKYSRKRFAARSGRAQNRPCSWRERGAGARGDLLYLPVFFPGALRHRARASGRGRGDRSRFPRRKAARGCKTPAPRECGSPRRRAGAGCS